MNVKINIAEVSNPDPMYSGLRAQCESKKCYVVVELIVVVTTYKPLLIPTTISSFRSKTPLSKSTTQLEAVLKFVDSKCDFGLQIWRCNSFRCHLNPSHDGKLKPLFFQPLFTLDNFEFRKVQKEIFRFSPMLRVQHCAERRKYFILLFFELKWLKVQSTSRSGFTILNLLYIYNRFVSWLSSWRLERSFQNLFLINVWKKHTFTKGF